MNKGGTMRRTNEPDNNEIAGCDLSFGRPHLVGMTSRSTPQHSTSPLRTTLHAGKIAYRQSPKPIEDPWDTTYDQDDLDLEGS